MVAAAFKSVTCSRWGTIVGWEQPESLDEWGDLYEWIIGIV